MRSADNFGRGRRTRTLNKGFGALAVILEVRKIIDSFVL